MLTQASNRIQTGFTGCKLIYSFRVGDGRERLLAVVPRPHVRQEPLLAGYVAPAKRSNIFFQNGVCHTNIPVAKRANNV